MHRTASGAKTPSLKRAIPESGRPLTVKEEKRQERYQSKYKEKPTPCRTKGCANLVYLKNKHLCEECREWRIKYGSLDDQRSMQNNAVVFGDRAAFALKRSQHVNKSDILNTPMGRTADLIDRILRGDVTLS